MQHDWVNVLGMLISLVMGVIVAKINQRAPDKETDGELIDKLKAQLTDIQTRDIKIVQLESEIARLNHSITLLSEQIEELKEQSQ